ncbi:glycoside hydrolase family 3 C-terminal domain-containing protein [Limibacter armeniacum]|uniref:glycoside hydrolase family 3 C-terminal domain-containing protein n=1 Tax=Limibacter armeniacum TaxID=466084 RepID=UPI002FE58D4B
MRKLILFFVTYTFILQASAQKYDFQDQTQTTEQRITSLLSSMTLEEKIHCLGTNPTVSRLNVRGTDHIEGLHGVAMGEPGNWGKDNPIPTTTFPQAIGMAQTWDTLLLKKMGEVEGYEARYLLQSPEFQRGGLVVRAPNADIGRDIRWGRNEECYGEDAFFNGKMTASMIRGLQGDHPKYWQTAALMKHFLANSNEDTRTFSSSDFDERLLREYYALPFEMGIKEGGSRAFMAAYNKVNQVPMMVSPLLKSLAIEEWGQDGIICTDGGALKLLISDHKYFSDVTYGASSGVKRGINQFLDDHKEAIAKGIEKGIITEQDIDEVLRGVFRVMIKLGMLDNPDDNPYAKIGLNEKQHPWETNEHMQAVLEATKASIVLLKNENNTLPINKKNISKIVLVGPIANEVRLDWYSGTPPYSVTILEGLKKFAGKQVEIEWIENFDRKSDSLKVAQADIVIPCVGNHPTGEAGWAKVTRDSYGKEAVDRKSIILEDEAWVKDLYELNPRMVMVLVSSFPYAINWSNQNVPAILHMTHNSQEMGNALAEVVFGAYSPAGKLVQTWPMSEQDLPELMDYNIRNGSTYQYFKGNPLYAFGYGLSYTEFKYDDLKITPSDDHCLVSLTVENIGAFDSDEVVEVYVRYPQSEVERPNKSLMGFARKTIKKGKKVTVEIPVSYKYLRYWNTAEQTFELEKGPIQILVGASSDDIRLKETTNIATSNL